MRGNAQARCAVFAAMRVFVTGGSGYIGRAVVRAFIARGHAVTALARSGASAERVASLGATPYEADLAAIDARSDAIAAHDALVHLAYAGGPDAAAMDKCVQDAFVGAARAREAETAIVYTSNAFLLSGGERRDESAIAAENPAHPCNDARWRPAHERALLASASDRIAPSVIRVGAVYGGADENVSSFFATARDAGAAEYVGDGANRWAMVHRDDLAALYVTVAEQRARGVFHGVDGAEVRVRAIAAAASVAAGAEGRTRAVPVEAARRELGSFADVKCLDLVVTTARARALGWTPRRVSFLEAAREAYAEWRDARA
jgi:nucleoside-diphosphate-sugar epimerase